MTYIIRKQGWEGCVSLGDARSDVDEFYPYGMLNGATYIDSDDLGTVRFRLTNGRIVHLQSIDLDCVVPFTDTTLREPYEPPFLGDYVKLRVIRNEDEHGRSTATFKGQVTDVNDDFITLTDGHGGQMWEVEWAEVLSISVL